MDGLTIKVRKRKIYLHGIATIAIPEQDVTLSGNPCFVVFRPKRVDIGSGIPTGILSTQSADAESDSTYFCLKLYAFNLDTSGDEPRYVLDEDGKFDTNIDAPTL